MFASSSLKSLSLFKSIGVNVKAVQKHIRLSSHFTYVADQKAPVDGPTTKMNMFQAINNALDIALKEDDTAVTFGEDVGFGGVFRCTLDLQVQKKIIRTEKKSKSLCYKQYFCCFQKLEKVWRESGIQYAVV